MESTLITMSKRKPVGENELTTRLVFASGALWQKLNLDPALPDLYLACFSRYAPRDWIIASFGNFS